MSETGKLFGALFKGLAKLIDLPALAGTIAQIRTQLLPAVLRLIGVLGSPENLNGLVDTLTKLTDAASNFLESGLLQFFNNLVTAVGLVAAGFNALTSIPVLGDLIKFVGTVGSYLAIGGIAVKVTANLVGNIQTLGRAAKKTAQALGLLKVVESVGGTAGGGKGLSKFTGLLSGLPAIAGVSAGAIGGIAVGIAALSAAIAVGAVKLNDWADSNRINAKSSADWSKELQQNSKDLKTIQGMKLPTQNKISGGYMQAPTVTTSFSQGTSAEQIEAYNRIQKTKEEIRDAIRVGDEGLKALDGTIVSFAQSIADGGFEIFKDSIKQIGLSAEETAEKLPQVTSFLASYGVTVEQFKSDPFQQARIGAQSYFEPPQVLRRCYAGCSSRLRADSYSLGVA